MKDAGYPIIEFKDLINSMLIIANKWSTVSILGSRIEILMNTFL